MVSVKRPNHTFRPGGKNASPSLLTVRNTLLAVLLLAAANLLVRTAFPRRNHTNAASSSARNIHDVYEEHQKKQQLRGPPQQEHHGVDIQPGHPKDVQQAAVGEHSDADDPVTRQKMGAGSQKEEEEEAKPKVVPKHPVDMEHVEEMQMDERGSGKLPQEETVKIIGRPKEPIPPNPSPNAMPHADAHEAVVGQQGTGPTDHAYVIDLVKEQLEPRFRHRHIPEDYYTKLAQTVTSLHGGSLESCEYLDAKDKRFRHRHQCEDPDVSLIAYNAADFTRYLCGHQILPNQAIALSEPCQEPAHLFPQEFVPITGHGMPPIQVVKAPEANVEMLDRVECDIPCEYEPNLPADQYVAGTSWHLKVSRNDPGDDADARIEKTAFRQDIYYSTLSFKSSIPLSYYNASIHSIRSQPALVWETAANKATFLVDKDCYKGNARRMKWFSAVDALMTTEAYGSCGHNTDLKPGERLDTLEGRIELARKNRILLAFEASLEKDHVTDIVWESLMSGAVPAILGSSNVAQYLPPNSFIDATLFNSWDKFAEHVKLVSENKTMWESYHAWRTKEEALRAFDTRMNFTRTSEQCRTCRWAYAKLYGLGWDHLQQVVRETTIPRRLCVDESSGLATQPFQESWNAARAPGVGLGNCKGLTAEADFGSLKRNLVQHDGIVDMTISSSSDATAREDIVLRLRTTVKNSEGAHFPHSHTLVPTIRGALYSSATIQDESSRVTVLADWETSIRTPEEGLIEITVQTQGETLSKDSTRRLRIITEDTHPIQDKMTEFYPSSFGKRMMKDFVDPIDILFAQI